MRNSVRLIFAVAAWYLGLTAVLSLSAAHAQTYPTKQVRMIVPFAAGGGTDVIARLIAQKLGDGWGQPVLVENRGGGGSVIGTEVVARSAPDGYVLLLTAFPFTTNAALMPRLPYDSIRDFAPVTLAAAAPLIVVVHPSQPVHSIKDLVALAKSNPGQPSYASSGNGGPQHLAGELFNSMAGVSMTHVPYKGTGALTSDLVGGHVPMSFSSMLAVMSLVKNGQLRAIAVTGSQRSAIAPDLPTVAEAGLKGYEMITWYGVLTRAGTPPAVLNTLSTAIARAVKLPEIRDKLAAEGAETIGSTPAAFAAFIKAEIERMQALGKTTEIKLE